MVKILPQSILSAEMLAAVVGNRLKKINARAILSEKIMPSITSGDRFDRSEIGPINNATINENNNAIRRGSISKRRPSAAPAKAACDMAYPIDEIFNLTTKTPIIEQVTPARIAPIIAINRILSPREII